LLCIFTLINSLKGRLFSPVNVRMLYAAGLVMIIASVLLPLLNGYAVPALIKAASGTGMGVGLDYSRSPQLWQGLALLFTAYLLHAGRQEQEPRL
jgi:predicted membrane metal-binding protein